VTHLLVRSLTCLLFVSSYAFAEETPAPSAAAPAAPAPKEPNWSERVKFEGVVDTYFSYQPGAPLEGVNPYRIFDVKNGSFSLAYVELAAGMAPEPAGFRIDLGFGPVADQVMGVGVPDISGGAPASALNEAFKHVQQAYVSIKVPGTQNLILDAGKFATTAGAEVIEARNNWLYSRSILFGYAIPFTHTGLRLTATPVDGLTLQASVLNGWESNWDPNRAKTVGLAASYALPSGTTVALNLYGGPEAATSPDWRLLADLVLSQNFGDKFALNLNVDYASEGATRWYGAALMGKLTISDAVYVAARAEYFSDPDGARTGVKDQSLLEGTLQIGFPVGKNAELRLEGREDVASKPGLGLKGDQTAQTTLTFAALAWF